MNAFIDSRFEPVYRQHPIVLADVGARGGLKKNWLAARRHLRLLGFEPDVQEFNRLVASTRAERSNDTYFNVALHNRAGRLPLHVTRDAGLTSIFEPNRAFLDAFPDASRFDVVDRREIETESLDRLVETHDVDDVDFIKADTQGSELFVLEGAPRTLQTLVAGVEVEVEFAPIYKDQPLFADVDRYLRGLGYFLFDLRPCYWKRTTGRGVGGPQGQVMWSDALYLKSVPTLRTSLANVDRERQRAKVLKAVSIALLYGYADYALEIARDRSELWTPDEHAAIDRSVRSGQGKPRSETRRRARQLATALRNIWRRRGDAPWSISDAELGNFD